MLHHKRIVSFDYEPGGSGSDLRSEKTNLYTDSDLRCPNCDESLQIYKQSELKLELRFFLLRHRQSLREVNIFFRI